MLRARLWYGPAGHGVGLDRFARYLKGPLGCRADVRMHQRLGRSFERIVMRDPLPAIIEMDRRPEVPDETAPLLDRLPASAPPGLAEKLAGSTARLEFHDGAGGPFVAATGRARSILIPLAFATDGIIEDVRGGRLLFFALPPVKRRPVHEIALGGVLAGIGITLSWLALRPGPADAPVPGSRFWPDPSRQLSPSPSPRPRRPEIPLALPAPPDSR